MSILRLRNMFGALSLAALLSGVFVQPSWAADEKPAEKKEAKERAKPRGQLPDYYKDVVDGTQRDKIYEIQKNYATKLADLLAQYKDTVAKRDAEIAALLTEEQKAKVAKLAEEGKAKAAANRAAKVKEAEKAAPAAPAATTTPAAPAK